MRQVLLVATVGGFVPQFEMNDVKLLKELGYNIHYVANFDNKMYSYDENLLKEQGVITHHVAIDKSPFKIGRNKKAYREIKDIIDRENIDLVHCHTPVGGLLARLAASGSRRKPKVIYTAHGFHFYKGASLWNWCTYYLVERVLARKTDVIITINQEDFNNAKKFHLRDNGKVFKIPGVGLDLGRFALNDSEALGEQAEQDKIRLVTIGELNENKNHKVVIEALRNLGRSDIYYDIYGRGNSEEYLRELVKQLDMEKYIHINGYTSNPEQVLKKADAFVFPSLREGLGMAALEAMACGVPVIAYDNRGTREYMKDGTNGVVCYTNSPGEYEKAIKRLADSSKLRQNMGKCARKTAEGYGVSRTEEIMREIYSYCGFINQAEE